MDYSSIIGQQHAKEYLIKSIENDRIAHALIFEGEEGMGKKTISMVYSKALMCKGENKPCNNCSGCTRFENGNHPDFRIIKPHKKKSITTEDITDLLSDAYIIPNEDMRKIYVIDKAHTMTPAAQNRLLKILEEPPEYLIIILLCDNISNVLPTILSRSIKIKLQKLSDSSVAQALMQNGYDSDRAKEIARLSGGNIGYAQKVAKDKKALNKYDEYKNIFFAIDNGMKVDAFYFLEKKKSEIGDILVCWQKILSNCIKQKSCKSLVTCSVEETQYANNNKLEEMVDKLGYILETEIRLAANSQYLSTIDWLLAKL